MTTLRSLSVNATPSTHLRAGIKWDPLERDNIEETYEFGSVKKAQAELNALTRQLKISEWVIKFIPPLSFFHDQASKHERLRDQRLSRKKVLEQYVAQGRLHSFDLDLCCFCYDREGKLVEYVSPASADELTSSASAFTHSGDDDTGTGEAFDEELLVNLSAIREKIHQVFFVVVSINHGFDQIKSGFWSIVNTSGEVELLATTLHTPLKHKVHVMAKMSRRGEDWVLDELAEYLPLASSASVPLHVRLDQLITKQYLTKPKPVPDSKKTPAPP